MWKKSFSFSIRREKFLIWWNDAIEFNKEIWFCILAILEPHLYESSSIWNGVSNYMHITTTTCEKTSPFIGIMRKLIFLCEPSRNLEYISSHLCWIEKKFQLWQNHKICTQIEQCFKILNSEYWKLFQKNHIVQSTESTCKYLSVQ